MYWGVTSRRPALSCQHCEPGQPRPLQQQPEPGAGRCSHFKSTTTAGARAGAGPPEPGGAHLAPEGGQGPPLLIVLPDALGLAARVPVAHGARPAAPSRAARLGSGARGRRRRAAAAMAGGGGGNGGR